MQKNQTSIAKIVACSQEKLYGGGHTPKCGRGLEGPFEPIKGPIYLTKAPFLPRIALRCPDKALSFIGLGKGLFSSKRALFRSKRFMCWLERSLSGPEKNPFNLTKGLFRPAKVLFLPKRALHRTEKANGDPYQS